MEVSRAYSERLRMAAAGNLLGRRRNISGTPTIPFWDMHKSCRGREHHLTWFRLIDLGSLAMVAPRVHAL